LKEQNLNLARKWRPKTFDQIAGQEISIRMLKNSLYLKKLFPVYLFSGQRGCGKTSTARIFATAINCNNLENFQQNPTSQTIPCLICSSCSAMLSARHPDFIEIDAASHTGVDNVRQIIESSSYVPLSGKKKIYLIDEAHMLSKAAFNAFLKILEDPPETVHFILATTEQQKFPQTVLSRCFQLTFGALKHDSLKNYIKKICDNEHIPINDNAIDIIIDETEGSARDALNLLEQIRFSDEQVTEEILLKIIGKVSNGVIIRIFEFILDKNSEQLLSYLSSINFHSLSPQSLWNTFIEVCRALLWVKHGVETIPNSFNKQFQHLILLANKCSLPRLYAIMQFFWTQEALFLQTTKKHAFLELILLQLCAQKTFDDLQKFVNECQNQSSSSSHTTNSAVVEANLLSNQQTPIDPSHHHRHPLQSKKTAITEKDSVSTEIKTEPQDKPNSKHLWLNFLKTLSSLNDHLLSSILSQALFLYEKNGNLHIQLSSNSKFFKDKIEESKNLWHPLLIEVFSNFSHFTFVEGQQVSQNAQPTQIVHTKTLVDTTNENIAISANHTLKPSNNFCFSQQKNAIRKPTSFYSKTQEINITNKETWPIANLIISLFPGKIRKEIVSS
jgi:DNA polymerase III subunit gamma/tau